MDTAPVPQASKLRVFHELLKELHDRGQRLSIVTQSPDMVTKAFIRPTTPKRRAPPA